MAAIPSLLSNREVFGIAPTGSGKTVAFSFPIILDLLVVIFIFLFIFI